MAGGYLLALYFMSLALASRQVLTPPALLGIALIVVGVVLVNGFGGRA